MRVFQAKGIYVKKLCVGTFCPFGNMYGAPGIPCHFCQLFFMLKVARGSDILTVSVANNDLCTGV